MRSAVKADGAGLDGCVLDGVLDGVLGVMLGGVLGGGALLLGRDTIAGLMGAVEGDVEGFGVGVLVLRLGVGVDDRDELAAVTAAAAAALLGASDAAGSAAGPLPLPFVGTPAARGLADDLPDPPLNVPATAAPAATTPISTAATFSAGERDPPRWRPLSPSSWKWPCSPGGALYPSPSSIGTARIGIVVVRSLIGRGAGTGARSPGRIWRATARGAGNGRGTRLVPGARPYPGAGAPP
jgi:hypothetical protein